MHWVNNQIYAHHISEYLALGSRDTQRIQHYRTLFEQVLDKKLITTIRNTTNKGMAIGNEKFIIEVKELTWYHL